MAATAEELEAKARSALSEIERANADLAKTNIRDRSKIASRVIWLYVAVVAGCFLFVLLGLWFRDACGATPTSNCFAWKEPAEFLLQVLTTAVLPIVTLVLGYYFGTAKADSESE